MTIQCIKYSTSFTLKKEVHNYYKQPQDYKNIYLYKPFFLSDTCRRLNATGPSFLQLFFVRLHGKPIVVNV